MSNIIVDLNMEVPPGPPGVDGISPHVGDNGNWFVGENDTGVKAEGVDGISPHIGTNGNWYVGTVDTGIKAQGVQGDKGIQGDKGDVGDTGTSPHIGTNGNWYVGTVDTGIKAQGPTGPTGDSLWTINPNLSSSIIPQGGKGISVQGSAFYQIRIHHQSPSNHNEFVMRTVDVNDNAGNTTNIRITTNPYDGNSADGQSTATTLILADNRAINERLYNTNTRLASRGIITIESGGNNVNSSEHRGASITIGGFMGNHNDEVQLHLGSSRAMEIGAANGIKIGGSGSELIVGGTYGNFEADGHYGIHLGSSYKIKIATSKDVEVYGNECKLFGDTITLNGDSISFMAYKDPSIPYPNRINIDNNAVFISSDEVRFSFRGPGPVSDHVIFNSTGLKLRVRPHSTTPTIPVGTLSFDGISLRIYTNSGWRNVQLM